MASKFKSFSLITLLLTTAIAPAYGANSQQPAVPVKVAEVKQTEIVPTVAVTATLHSRHPIRITSAIGGQLSWVAEPGSYMVKGETVAKMDLVPLQLQLDEQLAQVDRAKTNLDFQNRELKRLEQLKIKDATSAFQIDQTRSQRDMAISELAIAQSRSQQIKDQIARAVIKAPFNATVTERLHFAGENINRNTHIATMVDNSHLEARAYLPLKHLPYIKVGNNVALSSAEHKMENPISAIIPSADPRSQTFELRIKLDNSAINYWAAGQLVNIKLPLNQSRQALTVHRDALIIRRDGVYVIKIDKDNKAQRVKVDVGNGTAEWVAVKGELNQGDKVAIRGAERLSDGQQVQL